jgi:tetratricopeptide (TPR) repeat protein
LTRLFCGFPEHPEYGQALFKCQLALELASEAEETLEVVLETLPPGITTLLLQAELSWAKRDRGTTRSLVEKARKLNPTQPSAMRAIGILLLRLREWDALAALASQALTLNEQDPIAWLGLAEARLRKGQAAKAAEAALRAIGLKYLLPEAHFVLARALVAQGRWVEAREAMQTLLKLQPNHRAAAGYFKRMPAS